MLSHLITSLAVLMSTVSLHHITQADIMCYACNSYMSQCQQPSLSTTTNNIFQARCSTKCFIRQGEDDAIYRGCFDAFKAVKQLTDNYTGCRNQTWNNRVRRWCLCDSDLCNKDAITDPQLQQQQQQQQPPHPAAPLGYYVLHPHLATSHVHARKTGGVSTQPQQQYNTPSQQHTDSHIHIPAQTVQLQHHNNPAPALAPAPVWNSWQVAPAPPGPVVDNVQKSQTSMGGSGSKWKSQQSGSQPNSSQQQQQVDETASQNNKWMRSGELPEATSREHAKNSEINIVEHVEPVELLPTSAVAATALTDAQSQLAGNYNSPIDQTLEFKRMLENNPEIVEQESVVGTDEEFYEKPEMLQIQDLESAASQDEDLTTLDMLEYPYNQEFSHQVAWSPLDEYIAETAESAEPLVPDTATVSPSIGSKMAPESVDYPYNQDREKLAEMNYFVEGNSASWKEADMAESDEPQEQVDVGADYPYNQLFGIGDHDEHSKVTIKHGSVEKKADINATQHTKPTVQHIVHSGEDIPTYSTSQGHKDNIQSKLSQRTHANQDRDLHVNSYGTTQEQQDHSHLKSHGTSRHHLAPPASEASVSKINQHLVKELEPHRSHFSAVGVSKKDLGRIVAKESLDDGLGYEGYDEMLPLVHQPVHSVAQPVPAIRCTQTGYYQNPKDCTQFVACLFDHNTRTKVLHLMRCPAGLVWDNLRKLCMESSTTCNQSAAAASNQQQSDIDYLAHIAAAAVTHFPRNDVTLNLVKTKNKNSHV